MSDQDKTSRTDFIKQIVAVPAVALGIAAAAGTADAAGIRSTLKYQNTPGPMGKNCAGCGSFKPAKGHGPAGCTIIPGAISPKGYCTAWNKKH